MSIDERMKDARGVIGMANYTTNNGKIHMK